ncbi:MAG TPA: hypothetical protein VIM00_11730 [Candidatus Acidoferrum sp.]|jgi:hypothetical protein
MPDVRVARIEYPPASYQVFFFARWISSELPRSRPTLLFLTEWGIWPSSENWHLYYKLRQKYGDSRSLQEAPGHVFLEHEGEDLASFLQLSMLNGWGGYVLTEANHLNAFFSHDEYIEFYGDKDTNLTDVLKTLGPSQAMADDTTNA